MARRVVTLAPSAFVRRARSWVLAVLAAGALLASALVTGPPPTAPSPTPTGTWSTDGVVWDLVRVGNTIFLGGEFSHLVSPDGSRTQSRSNLAAISASTGQPLAWAPRTNGAVLALESSADGSRVFVGGHFTQIGGVNRSRLASVRTSDGTVDTAFTANAGGRVRSLLRQGNALFVGGEFGNIGSVGQRLVARVDARTGAVATGWNPVLTGGAVRGMSFSPDGGRLYLAGSFLTVDGASRTRYAAAVSASTGDLSSWRATVDQPLFDVATFGDGVYLAVGGPGIPNNRLQKHSASTGAELFRYIADGDLQDLEILGNTLYVGGHWDTDFDGLVRTMLVTVDLRDDHVTDVAPRIAGLYGVWKVLAGPEGVWLAGQFTQVGGLARRGFAFLPNASPQPAEQQQLLGRFDGWRYHADSAPAGWASRTFVDTGWATGRGEIGYGDGDEDTRIAGTRVLYARRSFSVTNPSAWRRLHLRLLADAGGAVYLNGTEVARDNLPAGALTSTTRALGSKWTRGERSYVEVEVPSSLLVTGTNVVAVEVHAPSNPDDMSLALELLGEPGTAPAPTELVGRSSLWRYRDTGVNPGTGWHLRTYDASTWRMGQGELGAGDGDETRVINRTNPAHVTDWFRSWFNVADRTAFRSVSLSVLAEDGAVVYVNNREVGRDNLPTGTITPTTRALVGKAGADERTWRTFQVPASWLVNGSNLVAVEVHQVTAQDPDSSFALRLVAG
jgi:hypothetical protein